MLLVLLQGTNPVLVFLAEHADNTSASTVIFIFMKVCTIVQVAIALDVPSRSPIMKNDKLLIPSGYQFKYPSIFLVRSSVEGLD